MIHEKLVGSKRSHTGLLWRISRSNEDIFTKEYFINEIFYGLFKTEPVNVVEKCGNLGHSRLTQNEKIIRKYCRVMTAQDKSHVEGTDWDYKPEYNCVINLIHRLSPVFLILYKLEYQRKP